MVTTKKITCSISEANIFRSFAELRYRLSKVDQKSADEFIAAATKLIDMKKALILASQYCEPKQSSRLVFSAEQVSKASSLGPDADIFKMHAAFPDLSEKALVKLRKTAKSQKPAAKKNSTTEKVA